MADDDTAKLKRALEAERGLHKQAAAALKAAKAEVEAIKTSSAAELESAQARIASLEQVSGVSGPIVASKLAELVDVQVKAKLALATTEQTKKIAALESDLANVRGENEKLQGNIKTRTIAETVKEAALASHVRPEAIADLQTFGALELVLEGDEVKTKDGATVDAWLDAQKQLRSWAWPLSRGANAFGSRGDLATPTFNNPFSKETFSLTEQSRITATDPAKADRLRAEAAASGR